MKCALIYVEHRFCTLMHPLDRCYVTQLTLDDLIMRIKKRPLAMRYQLFFLLFNVQASFHQIFNLRTLWTPRLKEC